MKLLLILVLACQEDKPKVLVDAALEKESARDYSGAIENCNQAIQLSPRYPLAHLVRGRAKGHLEEFESGIQDLTRALELWTPPDGKETTDADRMVLAAAHRHRARLRRLKGDLEGASSDCEAGLKHQPEDTRIYVERANVWLAREKPAHALSDLSKAVDVSSNPGPSNRDHAWVYMHRAHVLYRLRSWKESFEDFRTSLKWNPENPAVPYVWVWLLRARLGERMAATKNLSESLKGYVPRESDVWYTKIARFLVGEISGADLLDAAKEANLESTRRNLCGAHFFIGSERLLRGRTSQAIESFSVCLEIGPRSLNPYQAAEAELQAMGVRK